MPVEGHHEYHTTYVVRSLDCAAGGVLGSFEVRVVVGTGLTGSLASPSHQVRAAVFPEYAFRNGQGRNWLRVIYVRQL